MLPDRGLRDHLIKIRITDNSPDLLETIMDRSQRSESDFEESLSNTNQFINHKNPVRRFESTKKMSFVNTKKLKEMSALTAEKIKNSDLTGSFLPGIYK